MAHFIILVAALLFTFNGYSSASYCICKDGLSDAVLQKTIDYACGAGGDCSAIIQNGSCYSPNTVKAHCDYAANSYYQRKGQVTGSCDFSGTATVAASPPTTVVTGCTYPASTSQTGTSTTTGTTGTPSTTSSGTSSTGTTGIYGTGVAPTSFSDSSSQDLPQCSIANILTLLLFCSLFFFSRE
ncbi:PLASMODESMATA CALLOSE-BINDING PROTEIN 3-like protein [Drosera capensis]